MGGGEGRIRLLVWKGVGLGGRKVKEGVGLCNGKGGLYSGKYYGVLAMYQVS